MIKMNTATTKSARNVLTINLAQALLEEQAKSNVQIDQDIKQLKLELEHYSKFSDDSKSSAILQSFGFVSPEFKLMSIRQNIADLESRKVTTGIFTKHEIEQVAIKYGLRFLPVEKYRGEIPIELPRKLEEAHEKWKKIKGNGTFFRNPDVYIMAPKRSFKLEERPTDPLCFMKINENSYLLVHKWGNDLSLLRKILYWPLREGINLFFTCFLMISSLTGVVIETFSSHENNMALWFILITISCLTSLIASSVICSNVTTSDEVWDSMFI